MGEWGNFGRDNKEGDYSGLMAGTSPFPKQARQRLSTPPSLPLFRMTTSSCFPGGECLAKLALSPLPASQCPPSPLPPQNDDIELLPPMLGAAAASDVPGTKLAGRRPAARTRCVALSPTNRCWAAASTEGLLVYRCEQRGDMEKGGREGI